VEGGALVTASRYVQIVEEQLNTLLGVNAEGGLLIVSERPLPQDARHVLAGYAPQLVQYFQTGIDRDLHVGRMHDELESLGFIQLETGDYCHVDGNDVGDRILAGIISGEAARRDVQGRRRQWQILAERPWSLS
jgi:hypothetical protein